MKVYLKVLTISILAGSVFSSCVPSRMYDDLKVSKMKCDEEYEKLKASQLEWTTKKEEMDRELQALKREEAVERLRLIAMGTSGAWIWPPNARIMKVERPDERWQCELELAGG